MSTQGNPEMGPMAPGTVMVDSYGNYTSVGPMMCGDAYINSGYGCVAPGYSEVTMTPGVSGGESDKIVSKTVPSDKCGRAGLFNTSALRPSDLRPSDLSGGRSYLSDKVVGCDKISATVEDKSKLEDSGKESVGQAEEGGKEGKAKEDEEDNDSEGMDVGSDGDSGCPSECADLSPVSGPDSFSSSELVHSDGGETASVTEQSAAESSKPKGKRRYYMYGNHKLVKPIKEIPLRFQILLAETSAAKARCEGQPIYMQHHPQPQPMYDIVYYHANDDSQVTLNANASCFVPNPDGGGVDASANPYLPECYPAYCPVSGYPGAGATNTPSNSHAMPPAHVFVPPLPPASIPPHSPGSQNCQTIIVYSSQTTNPPSQPPATQHVHTISMPPPFPPPSSLPPPPIDMSSNNSPPVSNQAGRPIQVNHGQTKTTSTYVEQHIKTYNQPQPPNKSLPIPLNIPPPNIHPSSSNHSAPPVSMSPSLTYTMAPNYSSPTYMTMQPKVGFPPQGSPVQPLPSTPTSQPPAPSYPVPPGNQYMYVYTSPPAGQPATQPHVVYMVSPSYPSSQSFQQQGVLVPPTCPVPVQ
ncbi:uncharacterized protein LOC131933262 isoform X2 [Physella acuta]|nr:uncharacterized protein LOC131933262 isoform X2 [Physella acuta]XP_059146031.1 uncharacterized protein LOC131933262 isoform X2 [Physella acuta]